MTEPHEQSIETRADTLTARLSTGGPDEFKASTLVTRREATEESKQLATANPVSASRLAPALATVLQEEVQRDITTSAEVVFGFRRSSRQIQRESVTALARLDTGRLLDQLTNTDQLQSLLQALVSFYNTEPDRAAQRMAATLLGNIGTRRPTALNQINVAESVISDLASLTLESTDIESKRGSIRALGVLRVTGRADGWEHTPIAEVGRDGLDTDDSVCIAWGGVLTQERLTIGQTLAELSAELTPFDRLRQRLRPSENPTDTAAALAIAELVDAGVLTGIADSTRDMLHLSEQASSWHRGHAALARAELTGVGVCECDPETLRKAVLDLFRSESPVKISEFGRTVTTLGIRGYIEPSQLVAVRAALTTALTDLKTDTESLAWILATLADAELLHAAKPIAPEELLAVGQSNDDLSQRLAALRTIASAGVIDNWQTTAHQQVADKLWQLAVEPETRAEVLALLDEIEQVAPVRVVTDAMLTDIRTSIGQHPEIRRAFCRLLETLVSKGELLPNQFPTAMVLEQLDTANAAVQYTATQLLETAIEQGFVSDPTQVSAALQSVLADEKGQARGCAARALSKLTVQQPHGQELSIPSGALGELIQNNHDQTAVDAAVALRRLIEGGRLTPIEGLQAVAGTEETPVAGCLSLLNSRGEATCAALLEMLAEMVSENPDSTEELGNKIQEVILNEDNTMQMKLSAVDIQLRLPSKNESRHVS